MPLIDFDTFDCDMCVVETVPIELTLDQISAIISQAAQLVVTLRAQGAADIAYDLHEELISAGIFEQGRRASSDYSA